MIYHLVEARSPRDLEDKIHTLLAGGWLLQGGISVLVQSTLLGGANVISDVNVLVSATQEIRYYQAMVKTN